MKKSLHAETYGSHLPEGSGVNLRVAHYPPPLYSIEYQLFTTNNSNQQFPHILHAVKTDTTKKDTAMLPEKHRLCPSPCSPYGFASHLSIHQIR